MLSQRAGRSLTPALTDPDVGCLSAHPAPTIQPYGVTPIRQCPNSPGSRLATALRNRYAWRLRPRSHDPVRSPARRTATASSANGPAGTRTSLDGTPASDSGPTARSSARASLGCSKPEVTAIRRTGPRPRDVLLRRTLALLTPPGKRHHPQVHSRTGGSCGRSMASLAIRCPATSAGRRSRPSPTCTDPRRSSPVCEPPRAFRRPAASRGGPPS